MRPLLLVVEERNHHFTHGGITVFFERPIQASAQREPWVRIGVGENEVFHGADETLPDLIGLPQPAQFVDPHRITQRVAADVTAQTAVTGRLMLPLHSGALHEGLGKIIIQKGQHGGGLHQITGSQVFLIQDGAGIEEVLRVEKTRGLMVMMFAARLRRLRPLCLLERHDVFHEDAAIAGLPIPTARQRITKGQALE